MTIKRPSIHRLILLTFSIIFTAGLLTGIAGCPGDTNLERDEPPLGENISFEAQNHENKELMLRQGAASFFNNLPEDNYSITAEQLRSDLESNPNSIQIVDVREPEEFSMSHINGSINIPLKQVGGKLNKFSETKQIVVVCSNGQASAMTTAALNISGFNAKTLKGGFPTWENANRGTR